MTESFSFLFSPFSSIPTRISRNAPSFVTIELVFPSGPPFSASCFFIACFSFTLSKKIRHSGSRNIISSIDIREPRPTSMPISLITDMVETKPIIKPASTSINPLVRTVSNVASIPNLSACSILLPSFLASVNLEVRSMA